MPSSRARREPPYLQRLHPGLEVARYLEFYKITQVRFAQHIGLSLHLVSDVINGRMAISPATALRFGAALRTSPQYWLHAQATYDIAYQKRYFPAPRLEAFRRHKDTSLPTPYDTCMCGHPGYLHIDPPEGGCAYIDHNSGKATQETTCDCLMYIRLGGYLALVGSPDVRAGMIKPDALADSQEGSERPADSGSPTARRADSDRRDASGLHDAQAPAEHLGERLEESAEDDEAMGEAVEEEGGGP